MLWTTSPSVRAPARDGETWLELCFIRPELWPRLHSNSRKVYQVGYRQLNYNFYMVILLGAAGFSFWARADSKDCVDSKNLTEYWKQMLMQVSSGAGLEKVSAIVTRY